MNTKKEILVRTYLVYLGMLAISACIVVKLLIIQLGEGDKLRAKAFTEQIRNEEIEAERGTIYSEMGEVLSTSVPEFDIYVDYKADGLIDQDGLLFKQHIDSLTLGLANLFKDKTAKQYKQEMLAAYNRRERFSLLRRKISFTEYEALKQLPLVKLGRNKSGFIAMVRPRRLYPFQMLANRTIGLMRDSNKVGIEKSYDKYLQGTTGRRLVRYIAGGAGVPLEGTEQDPVDGSDVFTTLDVNIQDIAHQALHRMMVSNEALRGTCIVMEVKTGKIKAIANLGRQKDGSYWEDYNYALAASEPGSTWKLVTLLAALQDNKINLQSTVNLEGGRWQVAGQTVFDSEPHGTHEATVQQAFERSSNVGMAKLAYYHYGQQPSRFISHIKQFRMDTLTGVDLPGEARPQIYKPGSKYWSNTTLPWMGFGYNLTVTPLHTAMLYNAIANGGKMMKPYVVSAIRKDGEVVHSFSPQVLVDSICSPRVLQMVRACLEGVVERGTAKGLKTATYSFAGKTGTSLVADKGIKYSDHMYQSSFAGYFPADNPQYTVVVVIRNKPHAARYYGGLVAGPVFREIADKLYAGHLYREFANVKADSTNWQASGRRGSLATIARYMNLRLKDSAVSKELVTLVHSNKGQQVLQPIAWSGSKQMPALKGFGLKDAMLLCEQSGLQVSLAGKGKVVAQSIEPGAAIKPGQKVQLTLNYQ